MKSSLSQDRDICLTVSVFSQPSKNHFRKRAELKLLQNFVTFLLLLIDQIILTVHVADFGFLQALILSQSLLLEWVLVRDELAHIDLAVIT